MRAFLNAAVTGNMESYRKEQQEQQEASWRNEVMIQTGEEGMKFKPFEDWAAVFEPTAQQAEADGEPGFISRKVQDARDRARETMLKQIHHSITNTIMKLILEVASKMLRPVEHTLQTQSLGHAACVLNALNGVLLSYRFGMTHVFSESDQFKYLRGVAASQLRAALQDALNEQEDSEGLETRMQELEVAITSEVRARATEARCVVEAHPLFQPDTLQAAELGMALGSAREFAKQRLSQQLGDECTESVATALQEQVQGVDVEQIRKGLSALQEVLRSFTLNKIDAITAQVPDQIVTLLSSTRAILEMKAQTTEAVAETIAAADSDAAMLAKIDEMYCTARGHVGQYVSGLVAMLNALMGSS